MTTYFEYLLTPRASVTDVYAEGLSALALITDKSHDGVSPSEVNRYSLNVGTKEVEVSLLDTKMPKNIVKKLSKKWKIELSSTIKQIA